MLSMDERDDPGMRIYLREIGQVELLTPAEEVKLARRIKRGDEAARQQMIRANLRLVVKIAGDYARLGLPLLDLISEGNMGLMKAVVRFDPKKGGKLSTYAAWWIKQGIRRALANQGKTIRLPSHMVDKLFRMRRTHEALSHELGRVPTGAELAQRLEVPEKTVKYWLEVSQRPTSLDVPLGEDGRESLGDTISDAKAKSPFDDLNDQQLLEEMAFHVKSLNAREQIILEHRFGLHGVPAESLEEVGTRLGITRERVRQLQNQALATLREKMLQD
jgi:RNA polymerase primary sigma factor